MPCTQLGLGRHLHKLMAEEFDMSALKLSLVSDLTDVGIPCHDAEVVLARAKAGQQRSWRRTDSSSGSSEEETDETLSRAPAAEPPPSPSYSSTFSPPGSPMSGLRLHPCLQDPRSLTQRAQLAPVDETVILLTPPVPLSGVPIGIKRGCRQNDSLVNG